MLHWRTFFSVQSDIKKELLIRPGTQYCATDWGLDLLVLFAVKVVALECWNIG